MYIASKHVMAQSSFWSDQDGASGKITLLISERRSLESSLNQDMITDDEIDMIFPINMDYSYLDNCAQSFGRIEGNFSGISFRKTNTKINVETSLNLMYFSAPSTL